VATLIRHMPPISPPVQSLNVWSWNSRNGLSYVLSQRCAVLSVQTNGRCPRKRCMTKNIGMLLLAIYLILVGITTLFHIGIGAIVMGVVALIAGVLILIGK